MAWRKAPPALVELFGAVIPADARIERRQMFGYPAAFVNGKLFAGLHQESFVLRLPEADRDRLHSEHGAASWEPAPGRRMKEYVVLPEALLADRAALCCWLTRSIAFAAGLPAGKAKPRKRGRATARSRSARP